MIPVPKIAINLLDFNSRGKKYRDLLQAEIDFINDNRNVIYSKARKIYRDVVHVKIPFFRCISCDFELLEHRAKEYVEITNKESKLIKNMEVSMKITYKGKELQLDSSKKVIEILEEEEKNDKNKIACKVSHEVKSLNYPIKEGDKIELIDTINKDGRMIYIRGLLYIMAKAFNELYPEALLNVNYQLSNSMYCEIENQKTTEEMLEKVEEKMHEMVKRDLEIRKIEMTKEEAETFYKKEKSIKGKLQLDNVQKEYVSLYFCEEYYNYFYGVMPISTSYLTTFSIMKYHNGFLVRYPDRKEPGILRPYEDRKKLLTTLEEYEDIHNILKMNTVYNLNKKIRKGEAQDIILLDEALHEKKLAQIADSIAKKKNVKMVLIAGPSSSGKTTSAKRLGIQLRLNGLKPVTISVDNYFVERKDNPKDENGNYDFECIEAIDLDLFNKHLTALLNGEEIKVPKFDFKTGTKIYNGETMKLEKGEILVIEGIHCLNDRLTSSIPKDQKYKIYLSALTVLNIDYYNRISTTDTRLVRRIVRDHQFRGYSALQTLKSWGSVNSGEEKNIFPFQEDADSMFNTSLIYELSVLKQYAIPLLQEIDRSNPEYSEAKRIIELLKYFETIPAKYVPNHSLLREFIGGSIFE